MWSPIECPSTDAPSALTHASAIRLTYQVRTRDRQRARATAHDEARRDRDTVSESRHAWCLGNVAGVGKLYTLRLGAGRSRVTLTRLLAWEYARRNDILCHWHSVRIVIHVTRHRGA